MAAALVAVFLAIPSSAFAVGYITWSTSGGNAGTGGPHSGYQLTTRKCAVCHAVHYAAASNMPAGEVSPYPTGPEETQLLLPASARDACSYCHIDTTMGGLQIYGGVVSQYKVDDVYGHNGAATAECVDCHAVHGAGIFKGAVGRKNLKRGGAPANTTGNVQVEAAAAYQALNGGDLFNGNVNAQAQVSAFCTQCHKVWSSASEQTITASGFYETPGGMQIFTNVSYKNHPLKNAAPNLVAKGARYTGRVAWLDSTYCRSCHAAGLIDQAGVYTGLVLASFPHYTPARARFLTSGWGAYDTSATALGVGNPVNDPNQDGVCLRCHTNGSAAGNATAGVGVSY